ncbi:hypothetical protein MPH_13037 [Macrophomina phaseolina MS6]|uniref:Uncharacterized protein n=1 Tax=Macrophomina phaseolina (strain MS6) TaxID=1126212 RepID=K2RZC0_MACPH|nr:hypothetical protein MPH_13037 [Macrophomina phaseolina MS6]
MGHLNERGWINVATLVVYLPLLVGTLATLLRQGFRLKSFYYLLVFVLGISDTRMLQKKSSTDINPVKYVGAAMTIDVQLKNNASLYTPAAILSTIVLTPLIMSVGGIVSLKCASPPYQHSGTAYLAAPERPAYELLSRTATSPDQKPLITSRTTRLTHLSHLAVLASLALGIVGGLDVFSTTPDPNSNGKTYMRAAAGLAAGALFLIAVVVATNMANARLLGGCVYGGCGGDSGYDEDPGVQSAHGKLGTLPVFGMAARGAVGIRACGGGIDEA